MGARRKTKTHMAKTHKAKIITPNGQEAKNKKIQNNQRPKGQKTKTYKAKTHKAKIITPKGQKDKIKKAKKTKCQNQKGQNDKKEKNNS